MPVELWAKSAIREGSGTPPTVEEHCREVCEGASSIWDSIERDLERLTGLPRHELRQELRPMLLTGALLHDIGKANSAFQALLRSGPASREKQPIRHEILGAMLLADGMMLDGLSPKDHWSLVWAVAGHHLQMSCDGGQSLFVLENTPREVILHLAHPQVHAVLAETSRVLRDSGREVTPRVNLNERRFKTVDDSEAGLQAWSDRFARKSRKAWRPYSSDGDFQRQVALLKALLIAADVAGSALPADGQSIGSWIKEALSARLTPADLEPIVQDGHNGAPRPFQSSVAKAEKPATVVIAGCGNGKTTAAYMWAQKWGIGRKLFFTYPTTGTSSVGYEDYVLYQRGVTSALIHGRAQVDLARMRGTPEDDSLDEWQRLESLQAWDRQLVVCTVDTVLGLIQNQRRPLFSFPAIVAGAFVFDEIHSYDRRLFGELLTFLQTFPGAPVLLMSASIPPNRLRQLQQVLGNRLGPIIPGDERREGFKRYRLEHRDSAAACWAEVVEALHHPKQNKVLWVCNTVNDAIRVAGDVPKEIATIHPVIYHSRFRYQDRVARQKQLIDRFKEEGPCLAITTQVCEMSLDISASLLVTAECPLPSLVQRLGRLNRYAEKDDPWPCLVYPFRGLPYSEEPKGPGATDYREGMEATRNTVACWHGKPCSQADLKAQLDAMVGEEEPDRSSAWLHGGWQTRPLAAREGDQTITVIREEDLVEIERKLGPESRGRWNHKRLVPWTIPMLFDRRFLAGRRVGGYPVTPAGSVNYDEREGAKWNLK